MSVNFISKNIINVCLTKITSGNISSKSFHNILDEIKNVDNIPKSLEKALHKKAEKHPELKSKIAYAYHGRKDNIFNKEIEKQDKILENEKIILNSYDKEVSRLANKVIPQKNIGEFTGKVFCQFDKGFNFTTPKKTLSDLAQAEFKLSSAKKINAGNNELALEKKAALIEELTQKVSAIKQKYSDDRFTISSAIIDAAKSNQHLLSKKNKSYLPKIEHVKRSFINRPDTTDQVFNEIKKLMKLKDENKQQMKKIDDLTSSTAANTADQDTTPRLN